MFLGNYKCTLDRNSSFSAPAVYKKHISQELYITQGFDRNLLVLSKSAFQVIYKKLGCLNMADPLARVLFRLLLGTAIETDISSQGNIKIPGNLCVYAQIEKEIILIGQGDYFEIWSQKMWKEQEASIVENELNSNRFAEFELTTR